MIDLLPPPFGDVTRRWTLLPASQRDRHALRLLGVSFDETRIDRPDATTADQYRRLVAAAVAEDAIAFAWLATSHRPLLLAHGRPLFEDDPSEWGAVCLEALHLTLAGVNPATGRWMRRRVALRLMSRMSDAVGRHVRRRTIERATDPLIVSATDPPPVQTDTHLELSIALDRVLGRLEPATRDAFRALADERSLEEVARRHDVPTSTLRQRVVRARPRLQEQLAGYQRTAG